MPVPTLVFVVADDGYFKSHRLPLALEARRLGWKVALITVCSGIHTELTAQGIAIYPLHLHRSQLRPWQDLRAIRQLQQYFRQLQPDIVHLVAMKPVLFGALAAWWAKVPHVVAALAGLGFVFTSQSWRAQLLRKIVQPLLRLVLGRANTVTIVQNPDDARLLQDIGRYQLIRGSGVNVGTFNATAYPYTMPPIILFVGRLLRSKGVLEALQASRALAQAGETFCLQLVGQFDPQNPDCLQQEEFNIWLQQPYIKWLGQRQDVAALWQQAHIAVLPSYREGLPKALLEAASCARPIVATDVPGCREIVRKGVNGLLVPAYSVTALVQALRSLLHDAPQAAMLGRAGRQLVLAEFSEAQVVADTFALYRAELAR